MVSTSTPRAPEDLTADWLTSALREGGATKDSRVVSTRIEIVGAGAGFIGQLARVSLSYDRPEAGAPSTLIGKFPTLDPAGREIGNLFRFYEREVRFFREIAAEVELRTPSCYYSVLDVPGDQYLLLLEDLAPAVVGDHLESCTLEAARIAIREIAQFHAKWWESKRLGELDWMPFINDPVNLMAEQSYQQSWAPFIERFGDRLEPEVRAIAEKLSTRICAVLHEMAESPRTIVHGDYRLDNLFFAGPEGGVFGVIDWQISNRGPGSFDPAYFITGNLPIEMRRKHEMDLLHLYHDTLTKNGVAGYSFDDLMHHYRLGALFCLVYNVIGTGNLDAANERGMELFVTWLDRNSTACLDHNVMAVMPA